MTAAHAVALPGGRDAGSLDGPENSDPLPLAVAKLRRAARWHGCLFGLGGDNPLRAARPRHHDRAVPSSADPGPEQQTGAPDADGPARRFGWWDMFVHPDDDPRANGEGRF